MPCFHPLKGFPVGFWPSGKPKYKITSYNTKMVYRPFDKSDSMWYASEEEYYDPKLKCVYDSSSVVIGCGQCMGCRIDRSREWADRCMLERQYHEYAWFVTLTYDDRHLPLVSYADPSTGECKGTSATLNRPDVQSFLHNLRNALSDCVIRFFGCGEYGPSTWRPHYHLILFGPPLDDLVPVDGARQGGHQYFHSNVIQKAWSIYHPGEMTFKEELLNPNAIVQPFCWFEPRGMISVAECNWTTCAYVARYCTKKYTGAQASFYEDFNLKPPFTMCSTGPGIARPYYDEHSMELYKYKYLNIKTETTGKKIKVPHYFDRLYDLDYPEEMKVIKETRRKMAQRATELKLQSTDLDYMELLAVQEHNFEARISTLQRKEI